MNSGNPMNHLIPAEFLGVPLSIIDHAGQKWMTAEQVGLALGYSPANARTGITNLYNRNADEFTGADTCTIKLMANSRGNPITRIFSATGCNLLGFFSNTQRSKAFRAWAKQALAARTPAPPAVPAARQGGGGARVLITREVEREVLERFAAGWTGKDIARALGISHSSVSLLCMGKFQFSAFAGEDCCDPALLDAVAARHLEIERGRLIAVQQGIARRLRSTAGNQRLAERLDTLGQRLAQTSAQPRLQGGAA